jgi:hypothetical protein
MSTNPPAEEMAAAVQFFEGMGLPVHWHEDPVTGEFHFWVVDVAELPAPRGAERRRAGGRRRRRSR